MVEGTQPGYLFTSYRGDRLLRDGCQEPVGGGAIARRQNPEARILLCGDNDEHTQGNPGKPNPSKPPLL